MRQANLADVPAMRDVGRDSTATADSSQGYYEGLFASSNSRQHAERQAWIVEDEHGDPLREDSSQASEILGFLVVNRLVTDWELHDIVVKRSSRRRGVATLLLREFLAYVRAQLGTAIFLEVRESNHGARALYKKLGFEETGLRKGYYASPAEDAILCRLRLY